MNTVNRIRESNFELLRLVAIAGIVFHHLLIRGACTVGYDVVYDFHRDGWMGVALNSFVIGGVNCFILITGWFGVKGIAKGVIRLLIDCIVFGAISYLLVVASGRGFDIHELKASMEFERNWFIISYMMLLIVAPIIEASLKNVTCRTLGYWILLLTVFNVYFGRRLGWVNPNGYSVVNFVYIYYIGRFLRFAYETQWMRKIAKWSALGYVACALLLTGGYVGLYLIGRPRVSLHWFAYNAPLVLGLSIFEFLFFARMKICSKIVNVLATGVFGVFILHTTCYVTPLRNEFAQRVFVQYGYCGILGLAAAIFIVGLPIGVIVTKINSKAVGAIVGALERMRVR